MEFKLTKSGPKLRSKKGHKKGTENVRRKIDRKWTENRPKWNFGGPKLD